jgi:hypothetical protein
MTWDEIKQHIVKRLGLGIVTPELDRRFERFAALAACLGGEPAVRALATAVVAQWERDGRP